MQTKKDSIREAWVNTVAGLLINQAVLWMFGVPFTKASVIMVIMFILSTVRSYIIRRIFNLKGGETK